MNNNKDGKSLRLFNVQMRWRNADFFSGVLSTIHCGDVRNHNVPPQQTKEETRGARARSPVLLINTHFMSHQKAGNEEGKKKKKNGKKTTNMYLF